MSNTINYDRYPSVIHYMGNEYIGGEIKEAAKNDEVIIPVLRIGNNDINLWAGSGTLTKVETGVLA